MSPLAFDSCQRAWASDSPSDRLARFLTLPSEKQDQAYSEIRELAEARNAEAVAYANDDLLPVPNLSWVTVEKPKPRPRDYPDDLRAIDTPAWVERLTDEVVPPSGFIPCPLPGHEGERTESFKVYEGTRGVYCFGCHRGGDIYKFAQHLWECDFKTAADRLRDLFGVEVAA